MDVCFQYLVSSLSDDRPQQPGLEEDGDMDDVAARAAMVTTSHLNDSMLWHAAGFTPVIPVLECGVT